MNRLVSAKFTWYLEVVPEVFVICGGFRLRRIDNCANFWERYGVFKLTSM